MSRRLPIRLRLAATSVVLVVMVLVLTGGVVVALERQSLNDGLAEQATIEARSLLAGASQAEPDPVPAASTEPQPAAIRLQPVQAASGRDAA